MEAGMAAVRVEGRVMEVVERAAEAKAAGMGVERRW